MGQNLRVNAYSAGAAEKELLQLEMVKYAEITLDVIIAMRYY